VGVPTPWGVAVRDDGLTFFTELFNGGVGITSTKTRTVDGFIASGDIPTGIGFSPDGATVYVADQFGDVSVLDVDSRQKVGSIPVSNPLAVRVSPDGTQLFVATGGTSVAIVDVATRTVIKSVEVGFAPNGFAVHPDGRMLYVSSFLGGSVTEIDMFTGNALRTFQGGGTPQEMALNRKGTRLYIANEAGYLNEIELSTGQLAPQLPLQGGGFGVGVTPDDGQAFVTIPGAGLIQIFNLQNRKLAKNIAVGGEPRRIGFSQRGHIAAVTNVAGYLTFVR
jgi:YVTN family beta-propeller protein